MLNFIKLQHRKRNKELEPIKFDTDKYTNLDLNSILKVLYKELKSSKPGESRYIREKTNDKSWLFALNADDAILWFFVEGEKLSIEGIRQFKEILYKAIQRYKSEKEIFFQNKNNNKHVILHTKDFIYISNKTIYEAFNKTKTEFITVVKYNSIGDPVEYLYYKTQNSIYKIIKTFSDKEDYENYIKQNRQNNIIVKELDQYYKKIYAVLLKINNVMPNTISSPARCAGNCYNINKLVNMVSFVIKTDKLLKTNPIKFRGFSI